MNEKGLAVMLVIYLVCLGLFIALVWGGWLFFSSEPDIGYEQRVRTSDHEVFYEWSPNKDFYGGIKIQRIYQFKKAKFPLNFPDGGVSKILSDKIVFTQIAPNQEDFKKLAEVDLPPIDGSSRGNLVENSYKWVSDSKVEYKLVNGFRTGRQKSQTGQLELTALPESARPTPTPRIFHKSAVTYKCADGKEIGMTALAKSVEITLSDGRQMELVQTISGSGVRFANADESIVFWEKGQTAFLEENGKTTYQNCLQQPIN